MVYFRTADGYIYALAPGDMVTATEQLPDTLPGHFRIVIRRHDNSIIPISTQSLADNGPLISTLAYIGRLIELGLDDGNGDIYIDIRRIERIAASMERGEQP